MNLNTIRAVQRPTLGRRGDVVAQRRCVAGGGHLALL